MDHIRRAQQRVDRAKGLGPLRRNGVKTRHGGKTLECIGPLHSAAAQSHFFARYFPHSSCIIVSISGLMINTTLLKPARMAS